MRLLLVSEHEEFTGKLQKQAGEGLSFGIFLTPDELVKSRQTLDFDAAVCDVKFLNRLKVLFKNPIFVLSMLTSTVATSPWIDGLKQGADGVLFEEMTVEGCLATVSASLRRWREKSSTQRLLPKFGLLIDLERYRVELKGHVLDLTLTELKVLKELANEEDRVVPRAAIQQEVFGQLSPGNRSLDVHVCSLRKKLRPNGLDVESVRGVGYRLLPFMGRGQLKSLG
jgi:DNA-binding response OmpR family regulator